MRSPTPRTNLAHPSRRSKTNHRPFNRLQPLEISWLSFCDPRPLFSAACSLFSQNTGGGIPPSRLLGTKLTILLGEPVLLPPDCYPPLLSTLAKVYQNK